MSNTNKNKHLTIEERRIIETGIRNGSTKTAIARTIGKDVSTISKEVKLHRVLQRRGRYESDCGKYARCKDRANCKGSKCPDYEKFKCSRRDRSPGACNGCNRFGSCGYDVYRYEAGHAQNEYRQVLKDSREGVNMTTSEAKALAEVVKDGLSRGLSPYVIIETHPELGISAHTLYNYIADDVFGQFGISNIDLRRKVSRKLPKKRKNDFKKREDRKYLQGRTYKDYEYFISETETTEIVQMDTVYNDVSNGPFIQTFKFLSFGFMFALLHDTHTAADMVKGVDMLERILGEELFRKHVSVILTDRGPEFSDADSIENIKDDGTFRTKVFYCDPMRSNQKGSLENNHIELRYILPKSVDLRGLGLTSQDKLNVAISHINSTPKRSLQGKTPFRILKFFAPELYDKLIAFGLTEIEKDMVTLKPYLLK